MSIVFFCHAGICVAELGRNNAHGHAVHRERRTMSMAQYVK